LSDRDILPGSFETDADSLYFLVELTVDLITL